MADQTAFPLVRGYQMRLTRLNQCCQVNYGQDASVVTEGYVSIAFTASINAGEEIIVANANGKTCVRDTPSDEFQGYGLALSKIRFLDGSRGRVKVGSQPNMECSPDLLMKE